LVVAFTYLFLATFSRVETVPGSIVPDAGIAEITPTRSGLITSILVRDGMRVRAGDRLVVIRATETTAAGNSAQLAIIEAINRQDEGLQGQLAQIQAASSAEQGRLHQQATGLENELRELASQISVQQQMIESAGQELENARIVAARGFISRRDLQIREDSYLQRRQQLSQLMQSRSAKASAATEARRAASEAVARGRSQMASIEASRSELAQRLIGADITGTYVLTAPIDGVVTVLTARLGQAVTAQEPVMSIVPANGRLRAELTVPTRAVGFLVTGQEVRLAIDAFPYQQFGTVRGTIEHISTAAVQRRAANGAAEPVYLVAVSLAEPRVAARGSNQALMPGMMLSARIVTRRQSLFEWLFDPILSAGRR
jgi:membrane fusion protein